MCTRYRLAAICCCWCTSLPTSLLHSILIVWLLRKYSYSSTDFHLQQYLQFDIISDEIVTMTVVSSSLRFFDLSNGIATHFLACLDSQVIFYLCIICKRFVRRLPIQGYTNVGRTRAYQIYCLGSLRSAQAPWSTELLSWCKFFPSLSLVSLEHRKLTIYAVLWNSVNW